MEINSKCEYCGGRNIVPKSVSKRIILYCNNGVMVKSDVIAKIFHCKDCNTDFTSSENYHESN